RPFREIAQDLEPVVLALLRMELGGEDVLARDRGREWISILAVRDDVLRGAAHHVKTVDEVEDELVLPKSPHQRMRLASDHVVPPHVRDLQSVVGQVEPHDLSVEPAQTLMRSMLRA